MSYFSTIYSNNCYKSIIDFFICLLFSGDQILEMPVHTFASGPTNSMRGAAYLSGKHQTHDNNAHIKGKDKGDDEEEEQHTCQVNIKHMITMLILEVRKKMMMMRRSMSDR